MPKPVWLARFSSPTHLSTCTAVSNRAQLCVGALGERWFEDETGAYASPYVAPEDLVAAIPTDANSWLFVGRHGTRFAADTALGAVTSMRPSPRKFVRFVVQSERWFGITDEGELWQGSLDDMQGARAVAPERLFDIAVSRDGTGLALGAPERLWITRNLGAEWESLDVPPMGADSASVDEQGRLLLSALLPQGELKTNGITLHSVAKAAMVWPQLHNAPKTYPDAEALIEGRSARRGKEIFELRNVEGNWYLARGSIDSPSTITKVEGLEKCTNVRLAMSQESSLVLCRRSKGHQTVDSFVVLTSNSNAERFRAHSDSVFGVWDEVQVVAAGTGRFIATGLCPPARLRNNTRKLALRTPSPVQPECHPRSPTVIEVQAASANPTASFALSSVNAPRDRITAPKLAASSDGTRLAFVARKPPFEPWHVTISDDSGRTFTSHSIDELPVTSPQASTAKGKTNTPATEEVREILSLNFAPDNSLSVVYRDREAPFIANFDARGDLVATAMAPPTTSIADAVGSRILAVSRTERNVYESLDRGASFELVDHLPSAPCLKLPNCPLHCSDDGCLVGERFTRVGWGGRGEHRLDIAADPETVAHEREARMEVVSLRNPLVCQASTKAPGASTIAAAPASNQVSLFDSLWVSLWQDWTQASAGTYRALRGRTSVEKTTALAPLEHVDHAGLGLAFSNAGTVYLRSEKLPTADEAVGDLELAWMPARRSTWKHQRFHDASPSATPCAQSSSGAQRLCPELLAVCGESACVKIHSGDAQRSGTTIATSSETYHVSDEAWPMPAVRDEHWIKVNRTWNIFAFDFTDSHLLRAVGPLGSKDGPWRFAAQTVFAPFNAGAPFDHAQFDSSSEHPYLVLSTFTQRGKLQSLSVHELGNGPSPLDPGVALPLPATMTDPPNACTTRDRRELRRAVVPLLPNAARALGFVDEMGHSHWLVASSAVMYASEKRACLDALWADTLPGLSPISAVVSLEDLKHSWVFLSKRVKGKTQVQAQPVSCRFDTTGHAPPELEARVQTRFNVDPPRYDD